MRRTSALFILIGICAATAMWFLRRQSSEFKSCQAQLREWTQDWAGLRRYQTENASLKPSASSLVRPEAVFIGDSITEFCDLGHYFKGHTYINRGVQKQTTAQMLIRFRQDVLELHLCSVLILAGTGDIAGNTGPATLPMIENNLQSMVELAKAYNIEVFVASLPPVHDYGQFPASKKGLRNSLPP